MVVGIGMDMDMDMDTDMDVDDDIDVDMDFGAWPTARTCAVWTSLAADWSASRKGASAALS